MKNRTIPLAIGFLVSHCVMFAACKHVPGADQIWSNSKLHWVFIGENHGSNETPEAFNDLVCDAISRGKRVIVALERPATEQAALTAVLSQKDLSTAEEKLLSQPGWKNGMDGRTSEAMLKLLLSLRAMHATHSDLRVFAFDAPYKPGDSPGQRDKTMGQALLSFGMAHRSSLILILTGNLHAMQSPMFGYNLAAMFISPTKRLSLEVTDNGGEFWTLSNGACGPSRGGVVVKGRNDLKGIYLDPSLAPYGRVDGILALGVPTTASEPAVGEPDPLPECRKKFLSEQVAAHEK